MDPQPPLRAVKTTRASLVNRTKAVEPLTPLHRLAKFKEIRDKNAARDLATKPVLKRTVSFAGMEAKVNGAEKRKSALPKSRPKEAAVGPSGGQGQQIPPVQTNGVERATNGKQSAEEPPTNRKEAEVAKGSTEKLGPVVEKNVEQNGGEKATIPLAELAPSAQFEPVSDPEDGGGSERGGRASPSSSLDVVGEPSSDDSLDLHIVGTSSDETTRDESEPPKIRTPEIIRRLRAGGKIGSRRNLRGECDSPQLKRKAGVEDEEGGLGKRSRDDGTAPSPGWQFFSPSKSLLKLWSPFGPRSPPVDNDDSMAVNVDDESRIFDLDTANTLIEDSTEPPASKWCALM